MKILLPFVVIAVSIGMYFMYISPLFGEITILSDRKVEYENVLEKTKELKIKRDEAIAAYSSISEADLSKMDKIIPEKFDSVRFLNDVSNIASKYQLKIEGYTPSTAVSSEENLDSNTKLYKTNFVTIKLSGPYPQFVIFLKDVESSLQLVDIVNLGVIASAGKITSEVDYKYSINLNTYSLK